MAGVIGMQSLAPRKTDIRISVIAGCSLAWVPCQFARTSWVTTYGIYNGMMSASIIDATVRFLFSWRRENQEGGRRLSSLRASPTERPKLTVFFIRLGRPADTRISCGRPHTSSSIFIPQRHPRPKPKPFFALVLVPSTRTSS
jgi:hypothetical protein